MANPSEVHFEVHHADAGDADEVFPADAVMIGPYHLTQTLGEGSYATVKLGIHAMTGQHVAVKIISKSPSSKPSHHHHHHQHACRHHKTSSSENESRLLRKIEQEVQVLQSLAPHPNVCHLLDFLESSHFYVLVLEFVPDGDLFEYVMHRRDKKRRRGIPEMEAFLIFYDIVNALEHCHTHGIAHRDIKMENVLIDLATGHAKLTDFGLAMFIDGKDPMVRSACGSPHYMAPEVVQGHKHNPLVADVWSLGVVLYILYAGRLPFNGFTTQSLAAKIVAGRFEAPQFFPADLRDLLSRMLAPDVRLRVQLDRIRQHPYWLRNCRTLSLNPTCPEFRLPRSHLSFIDNKNKLSCDFCGPTSSDCNTNNNNNLLPPTATTLSSCFSAPMTSLSSVDPSLSVTNSSLASAAFPSTTPLNLTKAQMLQAVLEASASSPAPSCAEDLKQQPRSRIGVFTKLWRRLRGSKKRTTEARPLQTLQKLLRVDLPFSD